MSDVSSCDHRVVVAGLPFRLMIGPEQIRQRIGSLAGQIAERYGGAEPILVCVLNGAALFHADLVRELRFPVIVDYIRVSSYSGEISSSGEVTFSAVSGTQTAGRNVIIVEDIVDTGRTSDWLREYFGEQGAASVAVVTLLYKRDAHHMGLPPDFVGFDIPDRFVVGFGLDYRELGRNLPAIYALDEEGD